MSQIEFLSRIYKTCDMSKHARKMFKRKTLRRMLKCLELVHLVVCGPINSTLKVRNKYILIFIDDYSDKTWIYLMKEKIEVFSKFKEFKILVGE